MVVYDLDKLEIMPMEIVHDFPGGEWRRVQRAEGYHAVMVNGEVSIRRRQGDRRNVRAGCCVTAAELKGLN